MDKTGDAPDAGPGRGLSRCTVVRTGAHAAWLAPAARSTGPSPRTADPSLRPGTHRPTPSDGHGGAPPG